MKEVWVGHSLAGKRSRNRTGGEVNEMDHVSGGTGEKLGHCSKGLPRPQPLSEAAL